jgi:hypothetical protein
MLFVPVHDGAKFKNKLMGVMVYFLTCENKHWSALQAWFANHGIIIISHGQHAMNNSRQFLSTA